MASGLYKRLIALQLGIGLLTGCMVRPLTSNEQLSIQGGERVLVLLRMTAVVEGVSHDHTLQDVNIGLGSFETVSKVERIHTRCFSEETRNQGWLFFVLEPEVYYLAFQGNRQTDVRTYDAELQTAQKWRIDVPEKTARLHARRDTGRCIHPFHRSCFYTRGLSHRYNDRSQDQAYHSALQLRCAQDSRVPGICQSHGYTLLIHSRNTAHKSGSSLAE